MAEDTIRKLKDQLNCSVCLDTYTDPKQLECNHVYCEKCLVRLVLQDQQGQLYLTCPTCRQVTLIPDSGVAGLQSAFQINHFLDIIDGHEKEKAREVDDGTGEGMPFSHDTHCSVHNGKKMELYCETCEELICCKCALKGGAHHNHDYKDLAEVLEKYNTEITSTVAELEKDMVVITSSVAVLDNRPKEIREYCAGVEAMVNKTAKQLQDAVVSRKTKLINQLHLMTEGKLKDLAGQMEEVQSTQSHFSCCLDALKEPPENQAEMLPWMRTVIRQARHLTSSFVPNALKPAADADIQFTIWADMDTACQTYGHLATLDPTQCYTTWDTPNRALIWKSVTATLHAINFKGGPCKDLEEVVKSLKCECVNELDNVRGLCTRVRKSPNQYDICFEPLTEGWHRLHVTLEDEDVRGSPYRIYSRKGERKLRDSNKKGRKK